MPNISLNWTPANNGASSGQTIKRVAKINGTTPNITTEFTPPNILSNSQSTATHNNALSNIIYRYSVETQCSAGNNISTITEGLKFVCVPITFEVRNTTQLYCEVLHGIHSIIDGVNFLLPISNIEAVEFSLYNSSNTTLIQGPVIGTVNTTLFENSSVLFSTLSAGINYTIRYTLISTVNGIQIRSDDTLQLNTACVDTISLPLINQSGIFRIINNLPIPASVPENCLISVQNTALPFYTINTGVTPVENNSSAIGTHLLFAGAIVINTQMGTLSGEAKLKINNVEVASIFCIAGVDSSQSFPVFPVLATDTVEVVLEPIVSNLEFTWNIDNINVDKNLNYGVSSYGINGTFSNIDWGDGVITTSSTHTYNTPGDYIVKVYNSNATEINLGDQRVLSINKIPSTVNKLILYNNLLTNYPVINSTILTFVDVSNNLISNVPNFTGTPNLLEISFNNNNVNGFINLSVLSALRVFDFSNTGTGTNIITGLSNLSSNPLLTIVSLRACSLSSIPNISSLTNLSLFDISNNNITGILDVTNNPNLTILEVSNNNLTTTPSLLNNPLLQIISFTNTNITGVLNLTNCTLLTSINVSNNNLTNLQGFVNTSVGSGNFFSNNFSISVVNTLLQNMNSKNLTGLFQILIGAQTPPAPPNLLGLSAKNALISRGYTVNTD